MHLKPQQLDQGFGVAVGLGRQIAGIHPNHGHGAIQLTDQMQRNRRLDAEAGGEGKAITELLQPPAHPPQRIKRVQRQAALLLIQRG